IRDALENKALESIMVLTTAAFYFTEGVSIELFDQKKIQLTHSKRKRAIFLLKVSAIAYYPPSLTSISI
ncbi:MAG: hypothetical protein ABFQ95_06375, partial [Pseudomonadota bacterium]